MTRKIKGTFSSLDPKSEIFEELKIQKPNWWILFCEDNELYIDIRKDKYINVYYYGGSVALIEYKKDFVAETHQKYLGDDKPRGKTKEGKDKFENDPIDLTNLDEKLLAEIKTNVKSVYLRQIESENPAEKWIQGELIINNSKYIDSEFQYNKDTAIGKLRIDLIELSDGKLSFVELKKISDPRLRNDNNRNPNPPEIIEQMNRYQSFINKNEIDIKKYYETLIKLKQDLGLLPLYKVEFIINSKPKLIIADTYKKMTIGRKERIKDIKRVLENNNIDYEIFKCE